MGPRKAGTSQHSLRSALKVKTNEKQTNKSNVLTIDYVHSYHNIVTSVMLNAVYMPFTITTLIVF